MGADKKQRWEFRDIDCPVCGGSDFRVLGFHGGEAHRDRAGVKARIVQCRRCSLIYANPMPFPSGEDVRYGDVEHYFDNVMGMTDEERAGEAILSDAQRLLGGTGRILDVGCGRGAMVGAAAKRGWDAEGCDISEAFAKYATEVKGIRVSAGTLEAIRYPDDAFDVVTLVEVIEHLYDPVATLAEVRRILRPGGLAFVSTPNEDSLYQTLGNVYLRMRGRDWCVNLCPTWNLYHVLGFSPRSLRYLLTREGFAVEELVCYPGGIPVPKRDGFWGQFEQVGARVISQAARITGSNPYMYAWARLPAGALPGAQRVADRRATG